MRFRLADAFLSGAEELPLVASPGESVEGTVVDFSDSGTKSRYFAIVDVITRYAVVVPVSKLEVLQRWNSGPSTG